MNEIISKIVENNGDTNTYTGILVVFAGLIMISIAIELFNRASHYFANRKTAEAAPVEDQGSEEVKTDVKDIPEDELVAIATAVDIYHRLHFEMMQNEITFTHGIFQTPWKMVARNRKTIAR